MATVAAVILFADKKQDETWNVKVRVYHNEKPAYIDTIHYVTKDQIGRKSKTSKSMVIKDNYVLDRVAPDLKKYRDWISDHEAGIKSITAKELRDNLVRIGGPADDGEVDFLKFCDDFLKKMQKGPKKSSAAPLVTVFNSLKDYFKTDSLPITKINYNFLVEYKEYLQSERTMTRPKNGGGTIVVKRKGLAEGGLHNHMRDLRLLFGEAIKKYNDEGLGVVRIKHYPFRKFKVGKAPRTEHRDRPIEEVIKIRDIPVVDIRTNQIEAGKFRKENPKGAVYIPNYLVQGSRGEMARDLCMLSLYMLGMNAADLYEMPSKIGERYGYNRAKTRGKRADNAFISVKVPDIARLLLDKYAGKLQVIYSEKDYLIQAIDEGLKVVSLVSGIPDIDFYDFRHCVGSWLRNLCGYQKDDVKRALNQTEWMVTDIYISPDWTLLDEMQDALIGLLPAQ